MKDPEGGNLDRVQIVKGWMDANGALQEKVYDVAWSGDRKAGADGKLPPVGNTVDVANATWTNTIGSPELVAEWQDPDFDPVTARVLLRARPRDSDAALDRLRRQALQREDDEESADDDAGTRLHLAHLVHAGELIRKPRWASSCANPCCTSRCSGFALFLAYGWLSGRGVLTGDRIVITQGRVEQLAAGFEAHPSARADGE